MAERLPDEASAVRALAEAEGLDKVVIDCLETRLVERARECQRELIG
jgi:hypothetical protein